MNIHQEQEYNKDLDLKIWKKLIRFVLPYKKEIIRICIYMALLALIDAILPMFSRYAVDNFIVEKSLDNIVPFCILILVVILIQPILVKYMILTAGKIEAEIPYEIRRQGFKKLQELSLSFFDKKSVGWLMARMSSDVKKLGQALSWSLVDIFWASLMMLFMAILMISLNLKLALIVLAVVPLLVIVSIYFRTLILQNFRKARKFNSLITGAFNEGITGAMTIKTLVREEESLEEFKEITRGLKKYSVKAATISSLFFPIVMVLGSIATGLALWFGGISVPEAMTYGTLVAFISYTIQFFGPVHQFSMVFSQLQNAQASAERVISLIETEPDIQDEVAVVEHYGDVVNPKKQNWPEINGDISFRNVTFTYKDGEKVLENFNLNVSAGQTVALVGETGSGKTTIVNLACRFYEPTEGEILIDGLDYRKRSLLWLHRNLGYVLQEPHLFSGSIKDNISYGRRNASIDEIINAAKLVNAHDFIMKLDKGYDSDIGEKGSKLSTGEKQLISFARAILTNPKIFVLDEATSSVDTESEQLIQKAIKNVLSGRTSFIIAHRLSTIRSADRILVIEKGKVIEDGTHKELLIKKGYYYTLFTNQF